MKNSRSLELCHAWGKQQKADYNRDYYAKNKEYWVKYYKNRNHGELNPERGMLENAKRRRDEYLETAGYAQGGKEAHNALADAGINPEKNREYYRQYAEVERDRRNRAHAAEGDVALALNNMYERKNRGPSPQVESGSYSKKRDNARAGDAARIQADHGVPNNTPYASVKTKKSNPIKNATSSYTSAYKAGASTIAKAGKDFVKTWMSGWR